MKQFNDMPKNKYREEVNVGYEILNFQTSLDNLRDVYGVDIAGLAVLIAEKLDHDELTALIKELVEWSKHSQLLKFKNI